MKLIAHQFCDESEEEPVRIGLFENSDGSVTVAIVDDKGTIRHRGKIMTINQDGYQLHQFLKPQGIATTNADPCKGWKMRLASLTTLPQ